jgi:indoleamine 2,3-dioxygenase
MSPHKLEVLPSPAALAQYGISKNGFLPAETPLSRLPHDYYNPWEQIMDRLPMLVEDQKIREWVDELPVLDTAYLVCEAEWQRAHSMLAVIAQGYIWAGPEPSEVTAHPTKCHEDLER